jgi:hypothetical protein
MTLITIHQDQRPGDIVGTQVARKIIIQGGPTIQTMVSMRGYVSASGELWNEEWVTPKPPLHAPTIEMLASFSYTIIKS